MPIFISYNHQDKPFARSLARNLVNARHNVWIDEWELNAGDSLLDKIQSALNNSDAILVLISKNSVKSEWCKKELNAGLVRELEERRVLLIPCIIDDCEIPLFLREKRYVDFRSDKDEAFALLDRSLQRISNVQQSRIEKQTFHTDWSVDWGTLNNRWLVEWLFVDHGEDAPYVVVTRCVLYFFKKSNKEFEKRLSGNSHLIYATEFIKKFLISKNGKYQLMIQGVKPITETYNVGSLEGEKARLEINVRRLGIDNGMDTLLTLDESFRRAIEYTSQALRVGKGDKE